MSDNPMSVPSIRHQQEDSRGAWVIEAEGDGRTLAALTYSRAGADLIILDHTEVDPQLRGTGSGRRLVHEAVRWAREHGTRIMPLCPFARSVFDKEPELADVLIK